MSMEREKELALRASEHDPEAFAELYDLYVDKIYNYVYHKVGNTTEAEDLTAQVFTKAWGAIGGYEWQGYSFSPWLFRIAHNLVVDYHRARRPTVVLDVLETRPDLVGSEESRPEQILQSMMTMERVREAIGELTEEQQTVIVLRFIEGYSTADIARIMGKRRGAIRGLQFRGLKALRKILGVEEENNESR
ncbi:MAG: ECF RNA polymerase sigma factor SigW [Anaerolineales bacterium]|nr:ECF RNA polymerase sigma factor SigW [Anaerolineales bacterium]